MYKIYLVTGNKNKLKELKEILSKNLPLELKSLEIEEIQSLDKYEVARKKAKKAYELIGKPVVIEDVSFYFDIWKNFPGPLIKWFTKSMTPRDLYNLVKSKKKKGAKAVCVVCYFDGKNFSFFTGEAKGKIVNPKGKSNFGFDPIFQPNGYTKPYGKLKNKNQISHRAIAWKKFEKFLLNQ